MRYAFVMVLALACSKTTAQRTCDDMLDRLETCSGKPLSFAMRHSANEYCTISLAYDDPNDKTSLAVTARDALVECAAITACDLQRACFEKHGCSWIFTSPIATPQFQCMH